MTFSRTAVVLLAFVVVATGSVVMAASAEVERAAIKSSMEDLGTLSKGVSRAYAPFRRGAPADTTQWVGMADLHLAVGQVATGAENLRRDVDRLRETSGFRPAVGSGEFRRRLATADSLIALSRTLAAGDWQVGRPGEIDEARLWVSARAQNASQLAARTAIAAAEVAYAVGVTEGVSRRTLNLSAVGIIVVFGVLALIAGVVGAVRKLDDGWQEREQAAADAALTREPTIDETTVVLIAAACATVITGRHRVRRIRRLLSPKQKRTPWSAQGRLILQGSHAVGRKQN